MPPLPQDHVLVGVLGEDPLQGPPVPHIVPGEAAEDHPHPLRLLHHPVVNGDLGEAGVHLLQGGPGEEALQGLVVAREVAPEELGHGGGGEGEDPAVPDVALADVLQGLGVGGLLHEPLPRYQAPSLGPRRM